MLWAVWSVCRPCSLMACPSTACSTHSEPSHSSNHSFNSRSSTDDIYAGRGTEWVTPSTLNHLGQAIIHYSRRAKIYTRSLFTILHTDDSGFRVLWKHSFTRILEVVLTLVILPDSSGVLRWCLYLQMSLSLLMAKVVLLTFPVSDKLP